MKRLQRFFAIAILAVAMSVSSAWAQSPNQQFGMGITVGASTMTSAATTGGSALHFVYAVNPAIHVGATFGVESWNVNDVSYSAFAFGVFGKFLFSGPRELKPFIEAGFRFGSTSVEKVSVSQQNLVLSGGAEYFATPNVGIYAGLTPLQITFGDIEGTRIGISGGFLGAEWFF